MSEFSSEMQPLLKFYQLARTIALAMGKRFPVKVARALNKRKSWPTPTGFQAIDRVRLYRCGLDYYLVHDDPTEVAAALEQGAVEIDYTDPAVMQAVGNYFNQELGLSQDQSRIPSPSLALQPA